MRNVVFVTYYPKVNKHNQTTRNDKADERRKDGEIGVVKAALKGVLRFAWWIVETFNHFKISISHILDVFLSFET